VIHVTEKFKKGNQYVSIVAAVSKNELTELNDIEIDLNAYTMAKFIPASGAATRMFKHLYAYLDNQTNTDFVDQFFDHLEEFAFYDELRTHIDLEQMDLSDTENRVKVIETLLNHKMNYGALPKALIDFHKYEDRVTTPIDEHIYEGELYLRAEDVNLHFTISEEHEELFNAYVQEATADKPHVHVTYSFQKKRTDTLAVDLNNEAFRVKNGEILYRPGGHGALLDNLNNLEEDIIFIKNIDNICHQSQIEDTIQSKKKLAVIGIQVKEQIDSYMKDLLADDYDLAEIAEFIQETLNIMLKTKLTKEKALAFLNRPLRVCGVVKNEGEPGGGPYVVDNGNYLDLQICEKAEINLKDAEQAEILNMAEFFNPVDLVCFTKDYKGEKFDLLNFANEERYFISEKTYKGQPLKSIEHPGLWNGAMHLWSTIFVEVPLSTFNPVKTVNDLLEIGHQEKVETFINNI